MREEVAMVGAQRELILRRSAAGALMALVVLAALLTACGSGTSAAASSANGASASAGAVRVVAAENFYGDIVRQLGGKQVRVTSILSDPNADPHEYESSIADAKAIAAAQIVIENGAGYDSFMEKLLTASLKSRRDVINVADLVGKKPGDNPHLWYKIDWMERLADAITARLSRIDPAAEAEFVSANARFKASLQPIVRQMTTIREEYAGTHLTQTEPVFGYMGEALGLRVDDGAFQHAVEEGTDPSPQSVAQIEAEISGRQVKALLYNSQTTSPTTDHLKQLAAQANVPVVGVSELEPQGTTYQSWMTDQLAALEKALGG